MKHRLVALAACAALAACGGGGDAGLDTAGFETAQDVAIAEGDVLSFHFGPLSVQARIVVGPAAGRVQVYGVPGVADGTVYRNIRGLNWVSGTGDDQLQIEVQQAGDFDIALDTGTGDTDLAVKWIVPAGVTTTLTPSLSLRTGPGQKKLQIDLESFARDVVFDLSTDLGAGSTEFNGNLRYKAGTVRAGGRIDLGFGTGLNKAELLVDSEARRLDFDIASRSINELTTRIQADEPAQSARVNFRPFGVSGGGKTFFEMVANAPLVTLNHRVVGGAGADEAALKLVTLQPGSVTSRADVSLGESNDQLTLGYAVFPGSAVTLSGPVRLGGSDDEALLEAQGTVTDGIALDCGSGTDKATGFLNRVGCEGQ